jgi:fermentation-respiration switch protein FrsA (DUF1100 family)
LLELFKSALNFLWRHWPSSLFILGILLLAMTTRILERMFVYFPSRDLEADPSRMALEYLDVDCTAEDGVRIHGWYIPQRGAKCTLLIFHGNAGNISHRLGWIRMLRELGASVMIIDYRGYGKSEGKPSERGLYLDALAAYRWWSKEHPVGEDKLILIGESLGGAVAVDLACRVMVDGIVLQSTFTNAWDMAKTLLPIGLLQPLTGVRFDSAAKIGRVRCPKLFIHGDSDEIVPLNLGRKLYELASPPKRFVQVPGAGHNDLLWVAGSDYIKQIQAFLTELQCTGS